MLQYIVKSSDRDEIMEQTRRALEAGVRWIELKTEPSLSDADLTEIIGVLKPEVKKAGCVLTLASRVTLAKQTEVDGVQLYEGDLPASTARMELNAGPIIGISVISPDQVERQMSLDVDFFRLEPLYENGSEHLATLFEIAKLLRDNGIDKPLAAAGGINKKNVEGALAAGADGIAVDSGIASGCKSLKDALEEIIGFIRNP